MNTATATAPRAGLATRLWTYQSERFPVVKHGLLIAAFGASAAGLSAMLRGGEPGWKAFVVAIVVLFGLFLQLRIADEHKDAADDAAFRPERPVPRGLVTLAELRLVAAGAAAIQIAATVWLDWRLLALLALAWAWMGLMTREFFAPAWLKARPVLYMISHMAVMPLIDLFATACDWLPAGGFGAKQSGPALVAFLALSFVNGIVLEVARKSWAPDQEREGVETYSRLWGPEAAGLVMAAAAFAGLALSAYVHVATLAHPVFLAGLLGVGGWAMAAAVIYATGPTPRAARMVEASAGGFVLGNYLLLGVLPLVAGIAFP